MTNTTVSLTINLKGSAGQELKKIGDEQVKVTTQINTKWTQIGNAHAKFVNLLQAGTRATVNTARASEQFRNTSTAILRVGHEQLNLNKRLVGELKQQVNTSKASNVARQLGLRTEKQINTEIDKSRKNYAELSRLHRKGVVSANDMQRAYAAMNGQVGDLQNELRKVEKSSGNTSGHATATAGTWKEAAKSLVAMYGTMQAINAVKATVTSNLDFERDVLEMKQNAGMTTTQADQVRQVAIDSASYTLQTPQEILLASKSFARAGDKYEDIKANTVEAARAATVYRATPEQVANMDFDLRTKMGVENKDIPSINNMLYYHGNAGRFEMSSFAQYAPEMLSAATEVGIKGTEGANFVGALAQVLMNKASINEPGKVKTMLEQGAGHITAPHYVKGLKKAGINVEKYMPNGQFYGEGGVTGILDLADEMKRKGLTNPFNLSKAGFSDQETKKFWMSLMQYSDSIRAEMEQGRKSASQDLIGADLNEMRQSNFGKVKQAEITTEKLKLSDTGQKATNVAGTASQLFAENPVTASLGGLMAGALGFKTYQDLRKNVPTAILDAKTTPQASGVRDGVKQGGRILSSGATGTVMKTVGRAGVVTTVGVGAYDAYSAYKNPNLNQHQKTVEYAKAGGGTAGALAGGAAGAKIGAAGGAAIGSIFPVVGTGVGAAVGGVLGGVGGGLAGWWGGSEAGEKIAESVDSSSENQLDAMQQQNEIIQTSNAEIIARLDQIIAETRQNRPIPYAQPTGNMMLDMVSGALHTESTRHGSIPSTPLIFRK